MQSPIPKLLIVTTIPKNIKIIQPGSNPIIYIYAKFGDDRTLFAVTFDVCDV